jgi:hypothetical protein
MMVLVAINALSVDWMRRKHFEGASVGFISLLRLDCMSVMTD